jgi:hypothetical protein
MLWIPTSIYIMHSSFRTAYIRHGGDRKTFEVMTSTLSSSVIILKLIFIYFFTHTGDVLSDRRYCIISGSWHVSLLRSDSCNLLDLKCCQHKSSVLLSQISVYLATLYASPSKLNLWQPNTIQVFPNLPTQYICGRIKIVLLTGALCR